ncbi:hypothetical protein GCM10027570_40950 [Streptomonospora sediminis]
MRTGVYESPEVTELGEFAVETGEFIGSIYPECILPFYDSKECPDPGGR